MTAARRRLLYVVGTRPSAAMIAPVLTELRRRLPSARHALVHAARETATGELRAELSMPAPDYFLDLSPGSPVSQTTTAMERVERVIEVERPNLVLLADDSASTLSAALTALKLYIPTARLDAGLRTFDRHMPEEINRVMMDTFAELLFASREQAVVNLRAEGTEPERVHLVGSTVVDTLLELEDRFRSLRKCRGLGLPEGGYLLVALRESTLADTARLAGILRRLAELNDEMPVVLPAPEQASGAWVSHVARCGVRVVEPLGYLDQLSLVATAAGVITDSGSCQDEATFIGIPHLLLERTERLAALEGGRAFDLEAEPSLRSRVRRAIEQGTRRAGVRPALWDGRASERLADVVVALLSGPEEPTPLHRLTLN
jgi:UDP-N-acetylglucosamine 2-epimerase (non-hydrolysing)